MFLAGCARTTLPVLMFFSQADRDRLFVLEERIKVLEERPESDPSEPYDDSGIMTLLEALAEEVAAIRAWRNDITLAVDEGIKRVDRAERRIKQTVTRARKELEERGFTDPGLDAEAHELRVIDGEGGDVEGVPPVSEDVEEPGDEPSSIPGVSLSQLHRARGL